MKGKNKMQLYVLDKNPSKAVEMLADCHIIKMCLETAQILSSVIENNHLTKSENLPKPYNPNHPVIKAIDNQFKINYVLDYNSELHKEYIRRFNKPHAYFKLVKDYFDILKKSTTIKDDFSFARDFKDFNSEKNDIVEAYREYYRYKKSIIKRWKYTNSVEPNWLLN